MLRMMNETRESLDSTELDWSDEAFYQSDCFFEVSGRDFLREYLYGPILIIADALQHVFVNSQTDAEILRPLCTLSQL